MSRQAKASRWASREKKVSKSWLRSRSASSTRPASVERVVSIGSTNPRKGIADKHIDHPRSAVSCCDKHSSGRLFAYFADHDRFVAAWRIPERLQRPISVVRRHNHEKLAFVRDVKWIEPEEFARAPNCIANRYPIFKEQYTEIAVARK